MIIFSMVFLAVGVSLYSQDWTADPTYGDLFLDEYFTPDPIVMDGLAGGKVDLRRSSVNGLPRSVDGFVAQAPDLDLYYTTSGDLRLTVLIDGYGVDTVLLIRDPDGRWHFSDDSPHYPAREQIVSVTFDQPTSGLYSIWVGTIAEGWLADVDMGISEMY